MNMFCILECITNIQKKRNKKYAIFWWLPNVYIFFYFLSNDFNNIVKLKRKLHFYFLTVIYPAFTGSSRKLTHEFNLSESRISLMMSPHCSALMLSWPHLIQRETVFREKPIADIKLLLSVILSCKVLI